MLRQEQYYYVKTFTQNINWSIYERTISENCHLADDVREIACLNEILHKIPNALHLRIKSER